MVDILGLLRKKSVEEEMSSLRQIEWEAEYPTLLLQWFKDNNLYNTLEFLLPLLSYFTPNTNELKVDKKLYERIMWLLDKNITEIQNELKYYAADPIPTINSPIAEAVINPQQWIKLKDMRGQIPKPGEGTTEAANSTELLRKYTTEINELRHTFFEELKKINPHHKGGTVQTAKLELNSWANRVDHLQEININYDDEISDAIQTASEHIKHETGLDINAFGKINMKPGYAILSITTNGVDLRKILAAFRSIRRAKDIDSWEYDKSGKFINNDKDTVNRNKELMVAQTHLDRTRLGRSKNELINVNDSKTPIQIGWPIGSESPTEKFTRTWQGQNTLHLVGDVLIKTLTGDYITDAPSNASYYNPMVSHRFFKASEDKDNYTEDILNNNGISLPHLYIKGSGIMPARFPSQEIAQILNKAVLNYVNDLHSLFIEDNYPKQLKEIRSGMEVE